MFTGIVERTGTVVGLTETPSGGVHRLTIAAHAVAGRLSEGDSLAVSGVCLTALEVNPEFFHADLAAETMVRTTLGMLTPGSLVNLELPTAAGAPLGGHIVQGHVDGVGQLIALQPVGGLGGADFDVTTTDWRLKVRIPEALRPYMVPQGSVAIEGISLTIAATDVPQGGEMIEIAILPLTYVRTNLHALKAGTPVNVEADVMVKLAVAQMNEKTEAPRFELTEAWLIASGY